MSLPISLWCTRSLFKSKVFVKSGSCSQRHYYGFRNGHYFHCQILVRFHSDEHLNCSECLVWLARTLAVRGPRKVSGSLITILIIDVTLMTILKVTTSQREAQFYMLPAAYQAMGERRK